MIAVGIYAFTIGNPRMLLSPLDYQNRICGDGELVDKEFLYFPHIYDWGNTTGAWCVASCPQWIEGTKLFYNNCIQQDSGIFEQCPTIAPPLPDGWFYGYKSDSAFLTFGRCLPLPSSDFNFTSTELESILAPWKNIFTAGLKDVQICWWVILLGCGIALVLSFFYMCMLQCCASCLVWCSVGLVMIVLAAVSGYVLWYGIGEYQLAAASGNTTSSIVIIVIGAVLALIWVILFFIMCGMCSRIKIAIAIVEVACRAVGSMCGIVFLPLLSMAAFMAFTAVMLVIWTYMLSSPEVVTYEGGTRDFNFNWTMCWLTIFVIFFFFWGIFWIYGMTQTVISGAVTTWYFSAKGNDEDDIAIKRYLQWRAYSQRQQREGGAGTLPATPEEVQIKPRPYPVCSSLRRAFRHHVGSVAFGALIIALVATIRVILTYAERKLKTTQNKCLQYFLKCLQCFFGCCQRVLQWLCKNGYIMMMVNGKNFCPACLEAFQLLMRNILRTAALTGVSNYVLFMGKLLVGLLTFVASMLIIRPTFISGSLVFDWNKDVYYWWFPALLAAFLGYFIASAFFTVYGFAIDTIYINFLEDEERTKNCQSADPHLKYPWFAPKKLRELMDASMPKDMSAPPSLPPPPQQAVPFVPPGGGVQLQPVGQPTYAQPHVAYAPSQGPQTAPVYYPR